MAEQNEKMEFYLEEQEGMLTELDPHLQEVVLAVQDEEPLNSAYGMALEDGSVVVDVLAKLHRPDQEVPGLTVVRQIGQIVTGTLDVRRIEDVRTHENVISLKRATELHVDLQFSVGEIQASEIMLAAGMGGEEDVPDGTGVIVGVVDYGGDFRHRNFRDENGDSRLLFLWDQSGRASALSPAGFGYGREFDKATINTVLQTSQPYQELAYRPDDEAHGTHVMDIAAGNGRATGHAGVAPGADLIFVEVAAWDVGTEDSFGNSRRLLEAVDYIFSKADALNRPCVVNLSLGTHGGPHDGSTLVEQGFDALLRQAPGRAIVISAGNSHRRGSHASGMLQPSRQRVLTWEIDGTDETDNELEVWYAGGQELVATLITPAGQRLGSVPLNKTVNLMNRAGERVGRIIHRRNDPNNGDNHLDILLDERLKGNWQVELDNVTADVVSFHSWIERDHPSHQSRFALVDDDRTHTLGSISCGELTLVVGSYDARVPNKALSDFTSEGPTRDGKLKPEVSAPGHAIRAARATTQAVTTKWGTSMAAPHVAGLVALLFEAADERLPIERTRELVMETARNNPPAGFEWSARYGSGRVAALSALQQATQPQSATVSALDGVNGYAETHIITLDDFMTALANASTRTGSRVRVEMAVEPV